MRRFYYDSSIAKFILGLSSCHTITLGPFVFSKRKEYDIPQNIRNHETCHSVQWIEIACLVGLLIFALQLSINITEWWYLTTTLAFYLWYGIEYIVRLCLYLDANKAYKMVSFEQEAYTSEHDVNYIENRHMFTGWLKFL